jgi:hypothetical protein
LYKEISPYKNELTEKKRWLKTLKAREEKMLML